MPGRAIVFFLALFLAAPALAELTRYPVVFVHGIFAQNSRGDYFRGVPARMAQLGVPASFPKCGFSNGVKDRAARLARHLDETWPAARVNVVAHSIGGLATRELIARLGFGTRVASLTTISTPHRGTPVADFVIRHFDDTAIQRLVERAGFDMGALRDLTTQSCADFNHLTPDAPGVAYFSYGGAQSWWNIKVPLQPFSWLIKLDAQVRAGRAVAPDVRARLAREPWGAAMLEHLDRVATEAVSPAAVAAYQSTHGANDGVVPFLSTPWGAALGAIDMDHLDQIGWGSNGAASADFYESIVRALAERGF